MRDNTSFIKGLAKLENNVLESIKAQAEGKICPIIEIPEEFDPCFGVTFSSDLTKATNTVSMFDYLITRIEMDSNLDKKDSMLFKVAQKAVSENEGAVPNEIVKMIQETQHTNDIILASELTKEITDAYYYIMYRIARTTSEILGTLEGEVGYLLNQLIDPTFQDSLSMYVLATKLYRPTPDAYTMYNYGYNTRQKIMAIVSDYTYATMRTYLYDKMVIDDTELFDRLYGGNLHTYLYIFDNMISIILNSFQYKIAYCYSDTMRFDELIERNNDTEEE